MWKQFSWNPNDVFVTNERKTECKMIDDENKPEILYRYSDVGDWIGPFLKGESLRFSARTSFNDPFDCRPGFRAKDDDGSKKDFQKSLKRHGLPPAQRLMLTKETFRRFAKADVLPMRRTEKTLDQVGVLCLASRWNNSLMWSHYGDHHRGICVGFNSKTDIFRTVDKVTYQENLPIIGVPLDSDPETYKQVFLHKADCWAYEEEWRIIKPNLDDQARDKLYRELCCDYPPAVAQIFSDQRGEGIYKFEKSSIVEITIGMKISEDDQNRVMSALADATLEIPVFRICLPSSTYALARERVA